MFVCTLHRDSWKRIVKGKQKKSFGWNRDQIGNSGWPKKKLNENSFIDIKTEDTARHWFNYICSSLDILLKIESKYFMLHSAMSQWGRWNLIID